MGENDQRQRRQRLGDRRFLELGEAGVEIHPLEVGIVLEPGRDLLLQARERRKLLGTQRRLQPSVLLLVRRVDEDQPGDLIRVGGGVEADDDAAHGVADQDVGAGTPAARRRACRSATASAAVRGIGAGSLRLR